MKRKKQKKKHFLGYIIYKDNVGSAKYTLWNDILSLLITQQSQYASEPFGLT